MREGEHEAQPHEGRGEPDDQARDAHGTPQLGEEGGVNDGTQNSRWRDPGGQPPVNQAACPYSCTPPTHTYFVST